MRTHDGGGGNAAAESQNPATAQPVTIVHHHHHHYHHHYSGFAPRTPAGQQAIDEEAEEIEEVRGREELPRHVTAGQYRDLFNPEAARVAGRYMPPPPPSHRPSALHSPLPVL